MILDRVTITGADESVDPAELVRISKLYSFVEWGILFSGSRVGCPRYPDAAWLRRLADCAEGQPIKLAAHLCGRWVRDFVLDARFTWKEQHLDIYDLFPRVQLNFHGEFHRAHRGFANALLDEAPRKAGHGAPEDRPGKEFILQCDGVNDAAAEELVPWTNAVPLFDASGGAGIVPKRWPDAWAGVYCGYAGGLGPENLIEELARIEKAAGQERVWIDMERRVRSDDDATFMLSKVSRVLELAAPRVRI